MGGYGLRLGLGSYVTLSGVCSEFVSKYEDKKKQRQIGGVHVVFNSFKGLLNDGPTN